MYLLSMMYFRIGTACCHGNKTYCYGNPSFSPRMLALKKTAGAEAVFIVFTQKHPELAEEEPPFQHAPLANFLWFLISTITRSRYLGM